jgi:Domain of unknown function (DUF6532)
MYRHPIIAAMVSQLWFSDGKESDGVFMSESFNPDGTGIPFETISLVLTAVCHVGFGNYTDLVNKHIRSGTPWTNTKMVSSNPSILPRSRTKTGTMPTSQRSDAGTNTAPWRPLSAMLLRFTIENCLQMLGGCFYLYRMLVNLTKSLSEFAGITLGVSADIDTQTPNDDKFAADDL